MKLQIVYIALSIFLFCTCTKYEVFFDAAPEQNFSQTLILQLDGLDCSYNHATKTLRYSIDESKLINYNPLVSFQDYSQVSFEGKKLSNDTKNKLGSLELNKKYKLVFLTMDTENILFLEFTNIPIVQINTLDEIANEDKILGKLTIQYPTVSYQNLETFISVEYRGRSSINLPKKSYGITPLSGMNIELVKNVSFFNYGSNNKWALEALYNDESKLRNKISYEMWGNINQTTVKSDFVEVFINNSSKGLYRLSEVYTNKSLGLTNQSVMYKGLDNDATTKFISLPQKQPKGPFWGSWEQNFPDPRETIVWNDFQELSELIVTKSNAEFKQEISNKININQLIDYYLFIQMSNAFDNAGKNWQFLKKDNSSKFEILLWDMDATWGRDEHGSKNSYNTLVTNNLFSRLIFLNPDNFNAKLNSRWQFLRTYQLSDLEINQILDANFTNLESLSIIGIDNSIWNKSVNLVEEKAYMKSWIQNRLVFLDSHFN